MQESMGKIVRLSDIINSHDERTLLIDTTLSSCVGALPGLESFDSRVFNMVRNFDGIILNPGQAGHHANQFNGRNHAALLIRLDWTNAFRGSDFCLPVVDVRRIMIADCEDALFLGASAVVAYFMMGFDDHFEAQNIKDLSFLARECYSASLPLIVDIQPIGGKVNHGNFDESIKLGVSMIQELGADGVIIPACREETYTLFKDWIKIPIVTRIKGKPSIDILNGVIENGLTGILLSESIFNSKSTEEEITLLKSVIHKKPEA